MTKTFSYVFLEPGHKVLIVHRRLFADDKARLFTGTVDAFHEGGLLKVTGHSWSPKGRSFERKDEARTKIVSLLAGSFIVYQLPLSAEMDKLVCKTGDGSIVLTDGAAFKMDLSESLTHSE